MPNLRIIILAALSISGLLAQKDSPAEIAAQRKGILEEIMKDTADSVGVQRWVCAMGKEPESVKEARAGGFDFTPDASDSCVTDLMRIAQVGDLMQMYSKLAKAVGGTGEDYKTLPRAIGSAALANRDSVAVGNGKGAQVTPALAFDAGFTVAYTERAPDKGITDAQKLKTITEACLGGSQDAGTCFSVGYVYGAHAVLRPAKH